MNKEATLGYLAGYLDADGSICISKKFKQQSYFIAVSLVGCKRESLDLFVNYFSMGNIYLSKEKRKENDRPVFRLQYTARQAKTVLEALEPYLILKQRQAQLAIKTQELISEFSGTYIRYHPEVKEIRNKKISALRNENMILNKRGKND